VCVERGIRFPQVLWMLLMLWSQDILSSTVGKKFFCHSCPAVKSAAAVVDFLCPRVTDRRDIRVTEVLWLVVERQRKERLSCSEWLDSRFHCVKSFKNLSFLEISTLVLSSPKVERSLSNPRLNYTYLLSRKEIFEAENCSLSLSLSLLQIMWRQHLFNSSSFLKSVIP
jgi:hypothetical protein